MYIRIDSEIMIISEMLMRTRMIFFRGDDGQSV